MMVGKERKDIPGRQSLGELFIRPRDRMAMYIKLLEHRGQWKISLGGQMAQILEGLGCHVKEIAFQSVFNEEHCRSI